MTVVGASGNASGPTKRRSLSSATSIPDTPPSHYRPDVLVQRIPLNDAAFDQAATVSQVAMSKRSHHLGQTQQDAISLSSDSDAASIAILSVADSEESISLDDVLNAALGPSQRKGKQKETASDDDGAMVGGVNSQRSALSSGAPKASRVSQLTHPASPAKRAIPSSSITALADPSSSYKGKRRMVLDETLINGKDYTPPAKPPRKVKHIQGQSKLSQFLAKDPPISSSGPSRPPKGLNGQSKAGTSSADPINLDLDTSDDDVPLVATPRKRQVSRQPSRPPPASSSGRAFFRRGRSVTSFSDTPVALPIVPRGDPTSAPDDGLLDWLRISPSLSPSVSPHARPSSQQRSDFGESPIKRHKSTTPAGLKSSQPDRAPGEQLPARTQRARSAIRPAPATPQRRTRNTFLPPPKISDGKGLELVPETPPRPTDLMASLARTPTPSPAKQPKDGLPSKPSEQSSEAPHVDAAATVIKRRRAAFEELDEESYRPSPTTKLGREVRAMKKRDVAIAPPSSSSRPKRVPDVPGKYKLPTLDTPIHKWPRTRGTTDSPAPTSTRKASSPSKLRSTLAAEAATDNDATPRQSKRSSAVRKAGTPRSVKKHTPRRARPDTPDLDNSSDSSLSSPPLEPAEVIAPPIHTPPPEPEPSPQPVAEPEVDLLAEFADYAEWPESQSQSQRSARSPGTALLRTPSRSTAGRLSTSPLMKRPSLSPFANCKPEPLASQSSQVSVTTRVLAEVAKDREYARQREEEEFARRLEERKAQKIAEKAALLASDSEDEELHLSQVFQDNAPASPGPERRSRRVQGLLESKAQKDLITSAQTLTEEELAAQRQIDILYRKRGKKIDHEAFFKAADIAERYGSGEGEDANAKNLDLSFLDGEDREVIADCTGTQDRGTETKRQQRDADLIRPVFWRPAVVFKWEHDGSLPEPPFQWPEIDHTDSQEVYDLIASGIAEDLAREDGEVLGWLYETALASERDDLTTLATTATVNALKRWHMRRNPFYDHVSSFLDISNEAWDRLGAVSLGESVEVGDPVEQDFDHPKLKQARQTTTTVICEVAKSLSSGSILTDDPATLIRRLVTLAMDPETSSSLRSEIKDAIVHVTDVISYSGEYAPTFKALTDDLAKLPLAVQTRAICMLGQSNDYVGGLTRWLALSLLFRTDDAASDISDCWDLYPPVADLLTGMDIIVSGLREAEPDYYRLLDQLSLWSAAAGNIYKLVERWWDEKGEPSEDLVDAEQAEASLGLSPGHGQGPSPARSLDSSAPPPAGKDSRASSASATASGHDESRASSALRKVKTERPSPEPQASDEEDPLALSRALKYAANKVRDEPGISPLLKSRLNQLAQCIQQNVRAEVKLLEAAKQDRVFERGHLERGLAGQTRLSFGTGVSRREAEGEWWHGSGSESDSDW